jgi:enoyl-CoA hydratase
MVQGYCIFGGWMIASAMDVIFAASDAQFLPSHGQYFSAPWDMGARKAKEVLFEAGFLTADQALELGMVNRVLPASSLEEETLAYAERVTKNDSLTMRVIKFSVNQAQDAAGYTVSLRAAFHSHMMNSGLEDLRRPRAPGKPRRLEAVARALADRDKDSDT